MKTETQGYKITEVLGLESITIRRAGSERVPYVEIQIVPAPDSMVSYDINGLVDLINGLSLALTHATHMASEIEHKANG